MTRYTELRHEPQPIHVRPFIRGSNGIVVRNPAYWDNRLVVPETVADSDGGITLAEAIDRGLISHLHVRSDDRMYAGSPIPWRSRSSGRAAHHSLNEDAQTTATKSAWRAVKAAARSVRNAFADELYEIWPLARFAICYGGAAIVLYWIVVAVSWWA